MEEENKIYSTRDIDLASTLTAVGFKIEIIDYQIEGTKERPIGYFGFLNSEDLNDTIKKYRNKELKIEPSLCFSSLRGLKSQLEGAYKNPHSNFKR